MARTEMLETITVDCDSLTVLFTSKEIDILAGPDHRPSRACRIAAEAMQSVANRHGIPAIVTFDATSGRGRGESEHVWSRLAIDLADEVRDEAIRRA